MVVLSRRLLWDRTVYSHTTKQLPHSLLQVKPLLHGGPQPCSSVMRAVAVTLGV
jgi:hypothetical protein